MKSKILSSPISFSSPVSIFLILYFSVFASFSPMHIMKEAVFCWRFLLGQNFLSVRFTSTFIFLFLNSKAILFAVEIYSFESVQIYKSTLELYFGTKLYVFKKSFIVTSPIPKPTAGTSLLQIYLINHHICHHQIMSDCFLGFYRIFQILYRCNNQNPHHVWRKYNIFYPNFIKFIYEILNIFYALAF